MIVSYRPSPIPGLLLLAGCLLVAPPIARAERSIIATRLSTSSPSAQYGPAVAATLLSPGGTYFVPTQNGVEFRRSDGVSDTLVHSFRTAGVVREAAWSGSVAYLLAGERGIVAVDPAVSTDLVAVGSHDDLGDLKHAAFATASATLAVATDDAVFFLRETAPGALDLLEAHRYLDGRRVVRVQARSDSFLVLGVRTVPLLRMFLTLYRARSGSAPESLWEFQANGIQAQDLAWSGPIAFIAAGNGGVVPVDTETQLQGTAALVQSGRFVRGVDADQGSVVAIGEARTYAQFTRGGPKGATLGSELDRLTALEPFHVSLVGGLAVVTEDDQISPPEPDEVALSLLEVFDVAQPGVPARALTTGTGRVRRVAWDQGLAYVADYTGGLRIFRAASGDTSLVGAFPLAGNSAAYDVSVDGARRLAFLAAGTGGLVVVDVTDPSAPVLRGALPLSGFTDAVAVIADSLIVVARRGGAGSGVTFVDVTDPAAPATRGSLNAPFVQDPRALAVRDTVVFVADQILGLMSVGFRDPDAPAQIGLASGIPARDVDLSGTSLLVGTVAEGVQVVDVTTPDAPALLATLPAPPIFGVAQQGATGLALLGDGGALAIDLTSPAFPRVRGVIQIPGFSRDAVWVGDTLLVAASFGLERFDASPVVVADPALWFVLDSGSILPRLLISWTVPVPPGAIGWNLYRDTGAATDGLADAVGIRVNDSLLPTAVSAALDATVQAGTTYRYRLEAFFPDGSSRKAADGVIRIGSNSGLGRAYPNPYRPRNGLVLRIPYRVLSIDGGKSIELSVHDPSGRLVRRIRGTTAPGGGFGSMTWDGRDERGRVLADGVYFVKLTGPGIDDARQIILLR